MATSLRDFGGVRGRRGNRAINFTSLLADEDANLRQTLDGETVGLPSTPDVPDPSDEENGGGSSTPSLGSGDGVGVGQGPSADAGVNDNGAVGIGIGPASGTPGTGGLGGMAQGVTTGLGFVMSPVTAVAKAIGNVAIGRAGGGAPGGDGQGAAVGDAVGSGIGQGPAGPGDAADGGTGQASSATDGGSTTSAGDAGDGPSGQASTATGVSGGPSGDGGGGGGGGGSGTVICTEMHRRGWIDDATYAADAAFGAAMPPGIVAGYQAWATPLATIMRRGGAFGDGLANFAAIFALPWAQEMAHRQGVAKKGHWLGTAMLWIGAPICALIGLFVTKENRNAVA